MTLTRSFVYLPILLYQTSSPENKKISSILISILHFDEKSCPTEEISVSLHDHIIQILFLLVFMSDLKSITRWKVPSHLLTALGVVQLDNGLAWLDILAIVLVVEVGDVAICCFVLVLGLQDVQFLHEELFLVFYLS